MDICHRKIIDNHVVFFGRILSPLVELPEETTMRRCVGIIGAAEALSDNLVRGHTSREFAISDLKKLIISWLRN
jgi:hypothetical protein